MVEGVFEVFVAFFNGGYGLWLEFFQKRQQTPWIEGFHVVIRILAGGVARAADQDYGDFGLSLLERRDQFFGGHVFHACVQHHSIEGGKFRQRFNGFFAAVGGDDVEFRGLDDEFARGDAAGGFAVDHEIAGSDHASIVYFRGDSGNARLARDCGGWLTAKVVLRGTISSEWDDVGEGWWKGFVLLGLDLRDFKGICALLQRMGILGSADRKADP
jgi:hypothetical protein